MKYGFNKHIELKKGGLNINLLNEWYSTSCILEYEPGTITEGEIVIELYGSMPVTARNFKKLVEEGFCDGVIFHRVI